MKRLSLRMLLLSALVCISQAKISAQVCDNLCLDFDGTNDFIQRALNPIIGNANFTAECWFKTTIGPPCSGSSGQLLQLHNNQLIGPNVELKECDGDLFISWRDGTFHGPFQISTPPVNDNQWRHLAIVRQGSNLLVYINCDPVFQANAIGQSIGSMNLTRIDLGRNAFFSPSNFRGQLDEIRLWNIARTETEICGAMHCTLSGMGLTGLLAYWNFNTEGAIPGGNNGSSGQNITLINDLSIYNNDATLANFTLNGPTSNFVCATLPSKFNLRITDLPTRTINKTEICSGEPVHFCVRERTVPVTVTAGTSLIWEYWDGLAWSPVTIPAFTGFCFPVPPGTLLCSGGTLGYDEITYRAVITENTMGQVCQYFPTEKKLLICCPLSGGTVNLTVDPLSALNGTLCEGDVVNINVALSGVSGLGTGSVITWKINGSYDADYDNLSSFTKSFNPVGPSDLCFEATIKNCGCAPYTVSACVPVDPKPICGFITAYPSGTLIPKSVGPMQHEYYAICPGDAGALQMVVPAGFDNGNAVWQFQFPGGSWTDLGSSNPLQNTNVLPCLDPLGSPYLWPVGETCVNYRIENRPESMPSGCDPCYSNEVTVCLLTAPVADFISGDHQICKGESSVLTMGSPVTGLTYTWLHNGAVVGSGTTFTATEAGNYWVEISNGCQVTLTPWFKLEVCELIAAISCPLDPNECACEGEPITISGCVPDYSKDSCIGDHDYAWTIDNDPTVIETGCNLTHTPSASGTTYHLTVTNTITGCSDTAQLVIKPCGSN